MVEGHAKWKEVARFRGDESKPPEKVFAPLLPLNRPQVRRPTEHDRPDHK
jgi:hypothetical protein